jgi:16S rRNA (uracil1498-N3)-methyltransferase
MMSPRPGAHRPDVDEDGKVGAEVVACFRVSKPLRVPLQGLAPGLRELQGPVARYVSRVHRSRVGDQLIFFDPDLGLEAEARLVDAGQPGLYCELGEVRTSGYRAHPIRLIQGLAKGAKPDVTIRDSTALGVESILFVETERAVVHVSEERAASRLERWKRIATEAARQSGRGNLPMIQGPLSVKHALGQAGASRRLLLAARGRPIFEPLADWRAAEPVTLLVGPEGGFSASEASEAEEAGFLPVSLGSTTLRTELAGVAALGALVALSAARGIG